MSKAWRELNRSKWSKVRAYVLDRDQHQCQLRLPGCTGQATHVDHIVPVSRDADLALDPGNLRAACQSCNLRRGDGRDRRRRPVVHGW